MKKLLLLIIIPFLSFGQCQDETACNFNDPISIECNFFTCYNCDYLNTIPEQYTFYRDNINTVHFYGQTCRLQMARDIHDALTPYGNYNVEQVLEMFNEGTGFPIEYDCNKNIGNRTAQSEDFPESIKIQFDEMIEDFFSDIILYEEGNIASPGIAGEIIEESGSVYFVNSKGLEIRQAFSKGLIGAMCVDQINNKYLERVLSNASSNSIDELNPLGYTDMEHDLDEAFGNLFGTWDYFLNPDDPDGILLDKYVNKVSQFHSVGIADAIYDAFIIARHSITINDFETRDFQIEVIKSLINKVIVNRAIYYLSLSADLLSQGYLQTDVFHALSEAYGFIISLQFTDFFDTNQIENIKNQMMEGDGFWDITVTDINNIIEFIATNSGYNYDELIYYQDLNPNTISNFCNDLGCLDENACNYSELAISDDGSCQYAGDDCEGFDLNLEELVSGVLNDNCECELPLSLEIFLETKKIIQIVNVLGQKSAINSKENILIHLYDDGSVEKKYLIK